jgi:osmotically-inducible protein OsmY
VRIVRLLTDDPAFQESEASRAILADKLIQTRARTVLGAFTSERTIGTGLDVAVTAGKVTLSGVIGQGVDLASAVDKIRQIDGVKDVESNVQRAPIGSGI